jgi:hypothetical protein
MPTHRIKKSVPKPMNKAAIIDTCPTKRNFGLNLINLIE